MDNSIISKQIIALAKSNAPEIFIEKTLDDFEQAIRKDERQERGIVEEDDFEKKVRSDERQHKEDKFVDDSEIEEIPKSTIGSETILENSYRNIENIFSDKISEFHKRRWFK